VTSGEAQPTADSVRTAWPAEAAAIAELQRRAWADAPGELGASLLASVPVEQMTQAWHRAITRPPRAAYRVLVAVEQDRVVGLATTLPSEDADADSGRDGEVDQFLVDPVARHRGHGSRLLNACADTLRADGFTRASWWVGTTDDELRRFLTAAGWAPDGASREIGSEDGSLRLRQVRLQTLLD
jgi:GNAT superfamily N-acetyltransferase